MATSKFYNNSRSWIPEVCEVYERYADAFNEEGLRMVLEEFLDNVNGVLFSLVSRRPYNVKVAVVRDLLESLDAFRRVFSRSLGKTVDSFYNDVKKLIDELMKSEVDER